ncbi:MAG: flavodoxin-dependent (E)-4-hydroxy-3-methylbut-2-enyl-diphosphate synthase [Candidatus Omnitrophica bacterium]|nr:flavodoxin-dependent (E)-4-hydroxy-3-methylbut-2-enyl-diphosphate synthase [Candidatus Omnitrophota bacterium]
MTIKRRKSNSVKIGKIKIGGNAPVAVQSMANIKTSQVTYVIRQMRKLVEAGCEIIRVSVLDTKDAHAIKDIQKEIDIPLCADIHFNYQLALDAMKSGADKIRINPGNIKRRAHIQYIVEMARTKNIPIRIGVNSGSIDQSMYKNKSSGARLACAVLSYVRGIEKLKYTNLILSAKAHTVCDTIEANRIIAKETNYPLHLGLTASGVGEYAIIKSAVGIGSLLSEGIGDTIRVSLTDDPIKEVEIGYNLLQSLGLRNRPWEVIACPTCGRTEIDVIGLSRKVEDALKKKKVALPKIPYKIAVMGCVVNGPGESKEADIGITGGKGFGFIFKHGKMIRRVAEKRLLIELLKEIKK